MHKRSPFSDVDYHLGRSRAERDLAYRLGDGVAAEIHMRLSALHLQRALLLQAVRVAPVGNVHPFPRTPVGPGAPLPLPVLELPSVR